MCLLSGSVISACAHNSPVLKPGELPRQHFKVSYAFLMQRLVQIDYNCVDFKIHCKSVLYLVLVEKAVRECIVCQTVEECCLYIFHSRPKNKFSLIINVKRPADGMQKRKAYNVVAMNEEVLMIYSIVATNVFPRFSSFVATIF